MLYLWLPSADLAVSRVAGRVRTGGHHVPEETIRRRYSGGLRNFFALYRPLATAWRFYDNSDPVKPRLIAAGHERAEAEIRDAEIWLGIVRRFDNG